MNTRVFFTAAMITAATAGCHKTLDITTGGGGKTTHTTTAGKLPDCSKGTAPGSAGPAMKHVGLLDGACFWIDETEVTRGDYAAFQAAVAAGGPPDVTGCTGVDLDPAACEAAAPKPVATGADQPQACVDFCSAAMFCKWAGKALCKGDSAAPADAKTNQWYSACSHGGANDYPYGDTYDDTACNGDAAPGSGCVAASATCSTVAAGSKTCTTDDGVLDLAGNVAEWVDECAGSSCHVRGGSFVSGDGQKTRCEVVTSLSRETRQFDVGFRCCAAD